MWAAQARQRREYALELEAVAQLAHRRRRGAELATADGHGGPGLDARVMADAVLSCVREDFTAELALGRDCSEAEAAAVLREALLLTGPLVPTWSALYAGAIGVRHVKAAVDLLGDAAPDVAAVVQARVLPAARGTTAPEFRDRLRRALYRADAEAGERRRRAVLHRVGVVVRRVDEGVSELVVQGPTPAVHAAADAIATYAQLRREDGDQRPIGVLRAETALDLLLRPWDASRPPVTARVVLHTSLRGDRPGELDGVVVSAAECRSLLEEVDDLDLLVSIDDPATGRTTAVATPGDLARAARGAGLRPPAGTDAYQPTAAQQRFVAVRDRGCRMPGCRRRPGRRALDLDHGEAHSDGGPTACWNLCCLCRRHHRIKTHAADWHFRLLRDGTLEVRTPGGATRTTRPPGWYADPEPDPPWLDETAAPDPLRE
jgi:hypothetical protein